MKTRLMAVVLAFVWLASLSCDDGGPSGPTVTLVLAPEEGVLIGDVDQALEGVRATVERRAEEFDFDVVDVAATGDAEFVIEVRGITRDEALDTIGRTGLLQFCEPVMNDAGDVAVTAGNVEYQPQTCEPVRDADGNIRVTGGTISFVLWGASSTVEAQNNPFVDQIVWQPAYAELGGQRLALDGSYLRPNTFVSIQGVVNQPALNFEFTGDGPDIAEQVTERLAQCNYHLALFVDGEPVLDANALAIAPMVQGTIRDHGVITGLEESEAETLSALLNSGAYPFAVRVGPAVPLQ